MSKVLLRQLAGVKTRCSAPASIRLPASALFFAKHKGCQPQQSARRSAKETRSRTFVTCVPTEMAFSHQNISEDVKSSEPMTSPAPPLVSTQWLADNLHKVVVIDATWYLQPQVSSKPEDAWMLAGTTPAPRKDARKEYTERHIEGSRYFDLDEVSDHITKLPHMLPTPEDFEDHVRELGITADDHIVVYDSQGIFSAPRVWWTFKVFGHKNVSVLDGGLPKWLKEGRNVKSGQESFTPSDYRANFNEAMVIDFNTMLVHVTDFMYAHNFQILDARPRGRFGGYQPEPRAGLPSGHIPSAINIPASELVDPDTKTLLPREAIMRRMFLDNVDLSRPLVTMCGSGVTAAILYLALEVIGKTDDVRLYDGSWAEWASKKKVPITAWQ